MRSKVYIVLLTVFLCTSIFSGLEPGQTQLAGKTWLRYGYETFDGETQYSGFEIARGYFVFSHQFTSRIGSKFNLDVYSSDKSTDAGGAGLKIKAAYLDYAFNDEMKLYAGVIKNYFGTVYDWDYTTIEKALEDKEGVCASAGAGVAFTGYIPGGWGEYQAGVYNGEGYKKYLDNIDNDFTYFANIRFIPITGLMIGGSGRFTQFDDPADTTSAPDKLSRFDAVGMLKAAYGPVELWGEYLMVSADENTASGFMVMPTVMVLDKLQFVFRYDMWDPTDDVDDDGRTRMIAGANYFLTKNAKGKPETRVQLNWSRTQPEVENAEPTDVFGLQLRWEFSSNPF